MKQTHGDLHVSIQPSAGFFPRAGLFDLQPQAQTCLSSKEKNYLMYCSS